MNEANAYVRPDNGLLECRACRTHLVREAREKRRAATPETDRKFRGGYPDHMTCRTCNVTQPQEEFTFKTRGANGYPAYRNRSCKSCCAVKNRNFKLRRLYGISVDEYDRMLNEQGGGCALCGMTPESGDVLRVDHCHATGRVRGLLCQPCNIAVGFFETRIDVERMRAYLSS